MKTIRQTLVVFIALVLFHVSVAQPTPGSSHKGTTLIYGGTAHLGNGSKIEDAAIVFTDGVITYVGNTAQVNPADYDEVIEADKKHIYPGFISPNSTLGLQEIGAVRATRDQYETGTFRPNVRAVIAFNTDSEISPTVRTNGVLVTQVTPRGGTVSGTSGIVHLDGWNWEDAAIKMEDGVHVNWPRVYHIHSKKGTRNIAKVKTYDQQKNEIDRFFGEAKAYLKTPSPEVKELKYEALRGVFDGSQNLYVHANDVKQITEAVHFKRQMGIKNLVIVGGYDSHMVADLLRDNEVPVMIRRIHDLPRFEDDDVDLPYKLPKLLEDEGVLYCLENAGDMEQMGTRNLPFYAGTACAYGLTYEQAVMSLTLNTARILGVDDQIGSLEKGKQATLFISDGDALDMMTNNVSYAFIQGKSIDLDNRQKQLYRKFKEKYKDN